MDTVAGLVNRSFRRVERAAEAVMGHIGPYFVGIYVVLVGAGVYLFCTCCGECRPANATVTSTFLTIVTLPSPLQKLLSTHSPAHVALGLPSALFSSAVYAPFQSVKTALLVGACLFTAWSIAWQYYMAVAEPPGSVCSGLSEAMGERRTGPGSSIWWRLARERAARAAAFSLRGMSSPMLGDGGGIPLSMGEVHDLPLDGRDATATVSVQVPSATKQPEEVRTSFRFCKKCVPVTLSSALAMLPPELRRVEKVNRVHALQHATQEYGVPSTHVKLPSLEEEEDEGEAEIRTWLGDEEASRLVPPPKPERAHHCKVCGTCILKFDHHCPWINQCVGLGNERYFILFMVWFAVGCSVFVSTGWSLVRLSVHFEKDWPFSWAPRVLFLLIYVLAAVMGVAVGALACWHLLLVARGETSVENQDNAEYKKLARARQSSFTNVYDCGWRRNLELFFNVGPGMAHSYYTLLLPMRVKPYSDGWHYAKRNGLGGRHAGIAVEEEFTDEEP